MIGSLILLIFFFLGLIKKNYNIIVYVLVISMLNDLFLLPFGFALPIHSVISLFYLPSLFRKKTLQILNNNKTGINFIFYEFAYTIFITILFGIIFPWKSLIDYQRSWNQIAEFKSIIQIFRLIADFGVFILIFNWLDEKKISFVKIEKIIKNVIIVTVLIGITDFFLNFTLKNILFSNYDRSEELFGRFTSFCGEPRVFGKSCLFAFNYLLFFGNRKNYIAKMLSVIGILISLSASTFILFIISILLYSYLKRKFWVILAFAITGSIASIFLITNDFFMDNTYKKIEVVLSGNLDALDDDKITEHEPNLFTRFEVFDRAALNFLYEKPLYFFIGTGSNLVSIPASPYLSSVAYAIYGDRIDSAPHTFIVNLFSRSGLIGFTLWILFYFKFLYYNYKKDKKGTHFFIFLFFANFIAFNIIFYFFLGLIYFSKRQVLQYNYA
jgi:hypothetical protein